jgi:hypothetical protein
LKVQLVLWLKIRTLPVLSNLVETDGDFGAKSLFAVFIIDGRPSETTEISRAKRSG